MCTDRTALMHRIVAYKYKVYTVGIAPMQYYAVISKVCQCNCFLIRGQNLQPTNDRFTTPMPPNQFE